MNNSGHADLIESIRKEDKEALLEIYRAYFPQARHYIMLNSGNEFDAEDIFQDALVIIFLKARSGTLIQLESFGNYLIGVVKYLWLKELERKRKYFGTSYENCEIIADNDFFEDYIRMERRKLIYFHFEELSSECRKILELFLKETPLSIITSLMGYTSDQYTKNRRSSCKERLVRFVWNNPKFKELKNEFNQKDTKVPRW